MATLCKKCRQEAIINHVGIPLCNKHWVSLCLEEEQNIKGSEIDDYD